MKHCPLCRRVYADQSLNFCLDDGTKLTEAGGGAGKVPPGPRPSQVPTEVLPGGRGTNPAGEPTLPDSPVPFYAAPQTAGGRRRSKLLIAVLVVVLLTGGVGLGLILSRAGGGEEGRTGADDSAKAGQTPAASSTPTPYATPKPPASQTATPAAATPTPTATPEPTPNLSRARSEVMSLMNTWAESMRRQDVSANLGLYADRLDAYYQRGSVSREQVRSDRQAIFSKFYSSTDVQLDNIAVELDPSGTEARVTYDNSYNWRGGSRYLIGKSHNAMNLSKQGSRWLITSEEHLSSYGPDRSGN